MQNNGLSAKYSKCIGLEFDRRVVKVSKLSRVTGDIVVKKLINQPAKKYLK